MLSGDVTRFAMQTDLDDGELRIPRHRGGEVVRGIPASEMHESIVYLCM